MNYVRITFSNINAAQRDILIAELSAIGYDGFEEYDDSLLGYTDASSFDENKLVSLSRNYNLAFKKEQLEEQNWNALWESNYSPVVVDDYCIIRAEFHDRPENVRHDIVITPKMSFGTGHHATTYMMMRCIRQLDLKNKIVFDFGTGTGILAILCEKEGAKHVTAMDNDEWSITNARENILRNDCRKISVLHDSKIPDEKFDVILANINRNVIVSNADSLISSMKESSTLVVSGIMDADEELITSAFLGKGLELTDRQSRSGWLCLRFDVKV